MAIERITSADILMVNSSEEIIGLIEEVIKSKPELDLLAASPVTKTDYNTLVRAALPSVGFRDTNVGREEQKSTLKIENVKCSFLDASWSMDEAVATECEWGKDAALSFEASGSIEAAFNHIATQTWYGESADEKGFAGIASFLDTLGNDKVVNAGGTTENGATSIYAVCTAPTKVAYAWGQDGKIANGEILYLPINDPENPERTFWGYRQAISGWIGLQIPTTKFIGRVCNITEQDDAKATDNLFAQLFERFEAAFRPDYFFCNNRTLGQLRRSRTATNATGAEAPYPAEIFGIPVYVTDAIVNNEPIVA